MLALMGSMTWGELKAQLEAAGVTDSDQIQAIQIGSPARGERMRIRRYEDMPHRIAVLSPESDY